MHQAKFYLVYCILGIFLINAALSSKYKKSNSYGRSLHKHKGRLYRNSLGEHEWSYATVNGPEKWAKDFKHCRGHHQSPVDINEMRTQKTSLMPIDFEGYDKPLSKIQVQNNGHTVVVKSSEEHGPSIRGGDLGKPYNFSQLHFHWGRSDKTGSEHTVNGKHYPLELHFVHENSVEKAEGYAGIAVLSVLFKLSKEGNPGLEPIVKSLQLVRDSDKDVPLNETLRLSPLLPPLPKHYFRYIGSLTTPPCTEGVLWTVFKDPANVSQEQIQAFRDLHKMPDRHHNILDNFRPTQKLYDRKILESKPSYY